MTLFKHSCEDCPGHNFGYSDQHDRYISDEVPIEGIHIFLDNDYGLSIQRNAATYSTSMTFETAVLHRNTDLCQGPDDWRLCFRTPIASDVMSYQTGTMIVRTLSALAELSILPTCSCRKIACG